MFLIYTFSFFISFFLEGGLQAEVLWGTSEDERFTAENVLFDETAFSNSTFANYWLANKGKTTDKRKDEGFAVKIGNFKSKVVGVKLRNTDSRSNGGRATQIFKLEGSLLEPETLDLRVQEHDLTWSPEILKEAGTWDVLLVKMMKPGNQPEDNPPLETFFFKATKELRYLWFHLITFNGEGGGLQYFAPIPQLGEVH